jgi:hypothetical protein
MRIVIKIDVIIPADETPNQDLYEKAAADVREKADQLFAEAYGFEGSPLGWAAAGFPTTRSISFDVH